MSSPRSQPDGNDLGKATTALAMIVLFLSLDSLLALQADAQTAPGYIALFQDPPRTDQLTQADLPNLGRLVVLEATSMFVHARSDLYGSPESFYLLNDINTVWHAADAFVAAVSYYPTEAQRIEAGRLVFPSLQLAYDRLRDRIGHFPGSSQRVFLNLAYMSRPMAVIPPLLGQDPSLATPVPAAPTVSAGPSLAIVRELARELLPLVQGLRAEMTRPSSAGGHAEDQAVRHELEVLDNLVAGLDWIAHGGVAQRDLVASVRPIPMLAQRLDLRMRHRGLPEPLQSKWNAIKQRIDALAAQFQLPRLIVPLAAVGKPPLDLGAVTSINNAINQIEPLLQRPTQAGVASPAPAASPLDSDLRRLRTRLFLLRQQVLAQSPGSQIGQAIREVEAATARLEADARTSRLNMRGAMEKLFESVRKATKGLVVAPSASP
ncbi:MAG: hypothetical protein ACP5XB_19040 [Isosphaeraceae bacterium]